MDNKCRNPDGDPRGPWCVTDTETSRVEYCDIPLCGKFEEQTKIVTNLLFSHFTHNILFLYSARSQRAFVVGVLWEVTFSCDFYVVNAILDEVHLLPYLNPDRIIATFRQSRDNMSMFDMHFDLLNYYINKKEELPSG